MENREIIKSEDHEKELLVSSVHALLQEEWDNLHNGILPESMGLELAKNIVQSEEENLEDKVRNAFADTFGDNPENRQQYAILFAQIDNFKAAVLRKLRADFVGGFKGSL